MKQAAKEIGIIAAAWCATIAAVDPRGEFPLHDDWLYAVSTWDFVHTGHFHFPVFTVVSLRAQVLWGALFTRLFGESFEVLRISTLVLSLASLVIVNRILARAGAASWLRIVAPLALLWNPMFLWSSCTFMTDVPYLFCAAVSVYCFVRAIEEERIAWMIAGCIAVIVSWFIRQNGVINLFPPLAVLAMTRPRRWRSLSAVVIACGALFGLLLLFRRDWLTGSERMFLVHYQMWLESSFRLPEQVSTLLHYIGFNAINTAISFLPLTVPLIAMRPKSRPELVLLGAIAALFAWRTASLGWYGYLVPYVSSRLFSDILPGPLLLDFGVGAANLLDMMRNLPYPFVMPHAARILLTAVAAILASLLVWALAVARGNVVLKLAVASAAFGTLVLFASGLYFDRYALDSAWAVVIALPLIVPWEKRLARVSAIAALVVTALFSTLAVREHFTWQRVRWCAFHELRARGVPLEEIDGGADETGFYLLRNSTLSAARRGHPPRRYAITFRPLDGYTVVARYPFTSFLGMRHGEIDVLRKNGP